VPPPRRVRPYAWGQLGTALNPLLESGLGGDPAAKRLPIGNLINRVVGCALAVALLNWIGPALMTIEPNAGRAVADFHTGFNIVLALLFFPLLKPFARLLVRLLPARIDTPIHHSPSISTGRRMKRLASRSPARARGAAHGRCVRGHAARRTRFPHRGDRKRATETARMDNVLDRLDTAIKEYLTSIDSDALDDTDHRRLSEILAFTTNLEHAGDIVEKSLMPLASKRIKRASASRKSAGKRSVK